MKKYLVLLVIIICSVFGFSQQKTNSSQPTLSTDLTVQMNLRTDLEIYKGKVDTVSAHISALQDRQDKRIDGIETFIYWVLGLISALLVLLGIFLALFTYKTNRDYKKAEKELRDAFQTIKEAKKLQNEAKDRLEAVNEEIQKEMRHTRKNARDVRDTIDYEIKQGKNKIEDLINEAQNKIDTIVLNATKEVIKEIDKRNKIDALLRRASFLRKDKQGSKALEVLNEALKLDKNTYKAYYLKAKMFLDGCGDSLSPDYKKALKNINDALEIEPTNTNAISLRGYIYAFLNYPEEAMADMKHARALTKDSVPSAFQEIEVLLLLGKFNQALETLNKLSGNELDDFDKLTLTLFKLIIDAINNTISESELKTFIEKYEKSDFLYVWDVSQLYNMIFSTTTPFNSKQKDALLKIINAIQQTRLKKEEKLSDSRYKILRIS